MPPPPPAMIYEPFYGNIEFGGFTLYKNKIYKYSNVGLFLFYVCQTTEQHQLVFGSDRLLPRQNIQGVEKNRWMANMTTP